MKLPINWLREYLDFDKDPQKLIDKLTAIGHMQDGPPKKIADDIVYDLEIRQNRPDCLSIIGLAREAAAVLGKKIKYPKDYSKTLPDIKKSAGWRAKVEIQNEKLCYRFNTVTIEDLEIEESPSWLKKFLEAYGIKSINNVVDIANFVMVETGQPLHAFDAEKIAGKHLIIRSAKAKEKLRILGDRTITLSHEDLVIADPDGVIAMAGVIGGEETSVSGKTNSIILETATYNPATVRKTSLRHQLRTEASTRLEKFLHPHLTEIALARAAQLLLELTGGKVVDHTDEYPKKFADKKIPLNIQNLKKTAGIDFDEKTTNDILARLEISETIPYFRTDLEQEADIIEEVLRIYGYDKIPETLPGNPPLRRLQSARYDLEEEIKDALAGFGFDEEITDPLTKEGHSVNKPIRLQNSLNADKVMLRTTLRESLVNALTQQKKYRKTSVNLFEIGKIYFLDGSKYEERQTLGVLLFNEDNPYLRLKGAIEALFDKLGYELPTFQITKLDASMCFLELDIEQSFTKRIKPQVLTSPPQLILEDLSFFVPDEAPVDEILYIVKNLSNLIYKVELGETPKSYGRDQKTLFLKLALLPGNTKSIRDQIIKKLSSDYKAQLR